MRRFGEEVEAHCRLDAAHEGAPGRCHGGIVAGLFDDVFGFVLGVLREPAFTGELKVRYQAPTPLYRPLACRARLTERDGRKLHMTGELIDVDSDVIVARSTAIMIVVDPSGFAETQQLPAPSRLTLEVGDGSGAGVDERDRIDAEYVVPGSRRSPHLVVLQQVGVDEDGERRGVPERRDTADRVAGGGSHPVGVDPLALGAAGDRGQLGLVELVGAAHVGDDERPVDIEDQTLHDLAELHSDSGSSVGRRLGALGKPSGRDGQAALGCGGNDASNVGMHALSHGVAP